MNQPGSGPESKATSKAGLSNEDTCCRSQSRQAGRVGGGGGGGGLGRGQAIRQLPDLRDWAALETEDLY